MLAALALVSCEKDNFNQTPNEQGYGTLSFANANIVVSEQTETRVDQDYYVWVIDSEGNEIDLNGDSDDNVNYILYSNIPDTGISLPAGAYTLRIMTQTTIPPAEFGRPVYGVEKSFNIAAGQSTTLGTLTCTLFEQVAVLVNYNDEFKKHIMGAGKTKVTLGGNSLVYDVNVTAGAGTSTPSITRTTSTGYFYLVNPDNPETTDIVETAIMDVEFSGLILDDTDGQTKTQKMRTTITGVKPCHTHEIIFNMTKAEDGSASFTITIGDLIVDATLGEDIDASDAEGVLGEDPNKPKGDGGIKLNWIEGNADETIMNNWNAHTAQDEGTGIVNKPDIIVDPTWTSQTELTFEAEVPNKVYEFYVDILSTNTDFTTEVNNVSVNKDGRIYLTKNETNHREVITGLNIIGIKFPYSEDVIDKEKISFPLAAAIPALKAFAGTHTFSMNVTDKQGYQNTIKLTLVVK